MAEGMPPYAAVLPGSIPALVVQRQALPVCLPSTQSTQKSLLWDSMSALACKRKPITERKPLGKR
jgi:hypothetical protein